MLFWGQDPMTSRYRTARNFHEEGVVLHLFNSFEFSCLAYQCFQFWVSHDHQANLFVLEIFVEGKRRIEREGVDLLLK